MRALRREGCPPFPVILTLITGLLMALAALPRNVSAIQVTVEMPSTVSVASPTSITVTLTPSPSPQPVILTVRPILGSGGAQFLPGRQTQVTLNKTTTLELVGTAVSSWEGNMLLDAAVGGTALTGVRFSVIDSRMLSFARALQVARDAIRGDVQTQPGAPTSVELRQDRYVVWFGKLYYGKTEQGVPTVRGTAITVVLDAITGTVIQLVASPG